MNLHDIPAEILYIRIELEKPDARDAQSPPLEQEQDKLFDKLVGWCAAQHLFVGGTLLNAVAYAPLGPIQQTQITQLRELIESMPGIAGCSLELGVIWFANAPQNRAACLEAFSQAQRYLAERMADCAEASARLVPSDPRDWRASVNQDSTQLALDHWPQQIWLAISRIDGQPVPEFATLANKVVQLSDIQRWVPDWLGLHWSRVAEHPDADLSVGRWQAQSDEWKLWVTGKPSAQLTHREVMLRWMGVVGAE